MERCVSNLFKYDSLYKVYNKIVFLNLIPLRVVESTTLFGICYLKVKPFLYLVVFLGTATRCQQFQPKQPNDDKGQDGLCNNPILLSILSHGTSWHHCSCKHHCPCTGSSNSERERKNTPPVVRFFVATSSIFFQTTVVSI